MLFLFSLASCTQGKGGSSGERIKVDAYEPSFDLVGYAALIGTEKAQALETIGISENDLEAQENGRDLCWKNKAVSFGDQDFSVYLRFSQGLDGGETLYLSQIMLDLPIQAQSGETLYLAFADLQDTVMRICGRPRTYGLAPDELTTGIFGPAQLDPLQSYSFTDRFLLSEDCTYPGDEAHDGSVLTAQLDVMNEPDFEQFRYIRLTVGVRLADTLSGPQVDGKRFYLYL
ncbi:MAG: hypothetical protein II727_06600 [Oscillospiraceae bacterium]|nr:hypothetical protein [Oscillospiraceae bacterium]